METVTAHPEFSLFATMNPGGDYGKKELSPALRNRFTEIWVPPVGELDELRSIALTRYGFNMFYHCPKFYCNLPWILQVYFLTGFPTLEVHIWWI